MAAGGLPEAFTALTASIGLAAVIVNTLTSTISGITTKYYWYDRCSTHLVAMRDRLQKCERDLTEWEDLWGYNLPRRYPHNTYEMFWSREGLIAVNEGITRIRNSEESLKQRLQGVRNPKGSGGQTLQQDQNSVRRIWRGLKDRTLKASDRDWQTWKAELTKAEVTQAVLVANIDPKIRTKIAFSLWRKDFLTEDIARLVETANTLVRETTRKFRINQGHTRTDLIPTKDDIDDGYKLYHFLSRLPGPLEILHQQYPSSESPWHLQLEYTDQVACKDIRIMGDFDADILKDIQQARIAEARSFRMHFALENVGPGRLAPTGTFDRAFTVNYLSWFRETDFDDIGKWKASEKDRVTAVRGFINWTILLWEGNWNSNLCLCRIRYFDSKHRKTHLVCFKPGHGHVNHDELPRVWHFSVVIAGLLLATPIVIKPNNSGSFDRTQDANGNAREAVQDYTLWIWNRSEAEWVEISLDRLREKILGKTLNNLATEAVLYFLEKKNAYLAEGSNPGDSFRAMYLAHFINHVFTPIAQYCEERIKNYNDFQETSWVTRVRTMLLRAPDEPSVQPPRPTGDDGCFGMHRRE